MSPRNKDLHNLKTSAKYHPSYTEDQPSSRISEAESHGVDKEGTRVFEVVRDGRCWAQGRGNYCHDDNTNEHAPSDHSNEKSRHVSPD